jgi:hypothetical protein
MWLVSSLRSVAWALFVQPVFNVYMHGPNWIGWKSRPEEDICAQLTNVEASFWRANRVECSDLIMRDFQSIYSVVLFVLYAWLLIQFLQGLFFRYMVFGPVNTSIQRMLSLNPRFAALKAS